MEIRKLAVLLLLAHLPLLAISGVCAQQTVMMDINEYGVVLVEMHEYLSEGLQTVRVPVEPIPETIIAIADGEAVPIIYENKTLYLIIQRHSFIEISYIANVSIANNIFYLMIETNDTITLRIPVANVILLTVPREIIDYKEGNKTLILTIKGPQELKYTLRPLQTIHTPTQTTPIPTQTPPQTSQIPPSTAQPNYIWIAIAIPIIITAASGIAVIYLKRRGSRELTEMLNDVDIAIIKILSVKGGSALQTELQNSVNVPKTTLWRHIKKLEKFGIIRVEKVGLQNRIILIKKIKV
ncbi:MAG: winged helix-turn-helix transcriptional regulator [Ignisphaera sp.]